MTAISDFYRWSPKEIVPAPPGYNLLSIDKWFCFGSQSDYSSRQPYLVTWMVVYQCRRSLQFRCVEYASQTKSKDFSCGCADVDLPLMKNSTCDFEVYEQVSDHLNKWERQSFQCDGGYSTYFSRRVVRRSPEYCQQISLNWLSKKIDDRNRNRRRMALAIGALVVEVFKDEEEKFTTFKFLPVGCSAKEFASKFIRQQDKGKSSLFIPCSDELHAIRVMGRVNDIWNKKMIILEPDDIFRYWLDNELKRVSEEIDLIGSSNFSV
ncbi:hypothetical protein [Vibrio nigripulchritudo]|uniref:hypothetical protein n=1 Tax=Vibrio nigripulchritudo TaxID=28173 RepID=UPI00190B9FE2|nr:hypothetical protein [Vibrio nigripulchritudo]